MIPRKVAKRLLEEYLERVQDAEDGGEPLDGDALARVRDELLDDSDLVLRGAENIEQKARRYLTEGRLIVVSRDPRTGLVIAKCRGTDGMYSLGSIRAGTSGAALALARGLGDARIWSPCASS